LSSVDLTKEGSWELEAIEPMSAEIAARSPLSLFWRRLRQDKVALTALGFIVLLIIVAIFAPLIVKLVGAPPPDQQSTGALDAFGSPTGPSSEHWFGVDQLGRDVFSRVVYGARVSLEVAFISTGIAVVVGTIMGMVAGFYRGWGSASRPPAPWGPAVSAGS
jgi:peptide/nickel transport system permease protein